MKTKICRLGAMAAIVCTAFSASAHAQVNVTTYHNDNSRTGEYTQETVLTPANVSGGQFGKVFTTPVDGWVYAQPLYMSNVSIGGSTHNVLYVATENDTLYAIDAATGTIYWHYSLVPANGVPVSSSTDINCTDLVPEVGVTGTPVIDPTTGTIYLVAKSKVGASFYQYLHAIDVSTGAEKFGGPVNIQATFPGTAGDGNGTTLSFNTMLQNQRAALLLENGHVVIGWGSHCDNNPWHGWVMSYSASTLAQEAVYNTSPDGYGNGVWMAGNGLAADPSGNIYFATGNGTWNGTTDIGDSIVKLGPPTGGAFPVVDYFTPYNQAYLESNDLDMASGGIVLLPALPSGQELIAEMSKPGEMYLVNRNNMGRYCVNASPACTNTNSQIVQDVPNFTVGVWGSPAYWNGYVYWGSANWSGVEDNLQAFALNANGSGMLSTTATSKTTLTFAAPAPSPSISANGATAGILWALDNSSFKNSCVGSTNCQVLYAYDATDLANLLYSSSQAPNARDVPGGAVKYVVPMIANGKVYFGSQSAVSGYGLITTPVAMNPAPGSFTTSQSVRLTDTTAGAVIYYTTNGSPPTTNSSVYSAPIQVSATTSINAIAVAPGYAPSAVVGGTYSIGTTSSVSLASAANVDGIANSGTAVPGKGLDGGGYAYSAALLGTSLTWSGVNFAFGAPEALDAVSNTTLTLPAGNYSELYMLATGVNGNQANQSFIVTYTDGTTTTFTQSLSDWFTPQNYAGESIAQTEAYRINANGTVDQRTFYLYGYSFAINNAKTVKSLTLPKNANVVVLGVTLQATTTVPTTAAVAFAPVPGSFATAQSVQLTDTTPGAVIYYTTNGSPATTNSPVYSTALNVSATTTINAIAAAPNYATGADISGTYTIGSTTATNVNLAAVANIYGIAVNGAAVPGTGLDGSGNAYSSALLGTTLTWSGASFTLGTPETLDAVSNATVTLPAGTFSKLYMLATGVNGNQANQSFIVTYSDGTTTAFTQSLSDWFTPQGYAGESTAQTGAYRVTPNGMSGAGPFNVYGYSFALNSAKTVKSLTLPKNANVAVLAVTLQNVTTVPTTAAVTFTPAPGSFTTAQAVKLADTTPGAVIYYTTNGSPPTTNSSVYSTALNVATTTTINAIAAAPSYATSTLTSGTYTIGATIATNVNLAAVANVYGIAVNGATVPGAGLDGSGYAYSATLLGSSLSWSGISFTLGAAEALDAVSGATVTLPAGTFSKLYMLATGLNGNQANQTFIVTYTDGTTSTFTQSLSDWFTPQSYAGEAAAQTESYRVSPNGTLDQRTFYLYGYTFTLNNAKTVKSLALPSNTNVVMLAATLTP
jgi:Chitobiase/beta-hexosaminidase C-terminal domain/PQQ enzyme repeat